MNDNRAYDQVRADIENLSKDILWMHTRLGNNIHEFSCYRSLTVISLQSFKRLLSLHSLLFYCE